MVRCVSFDVRERRDNMSSGLDALPDFGHIARGGFVFERLAKTSSQPPTRVAMEPGVKLLLQFFSEEKGVQGFKGFKGLCTVPLYNEIYLLLALYSSKSTLKPLETLE